MLRSPSPRTFPKKSWSALLSAMFATTAMGAPQTPANSAPAAFMSMVGTQVKQPSYRIVHLDLSVLQNLAYADRKAFILLKLPLPDGGETGFTLSDSNTLPPELAQRYPQIRSMSGSDL